MLNPQQDQEVEIHPENPSSSVASTPLSDQLPRQGTSVGVGVATNNNSQTSTNININLDVGDLSSDEEQEGCPPQQDGGQLIDLKKELVFSPYYHILRYSRPLRRAEVMGFVFVFISIMAIAVQAQFGLEAVGFFVPTLGMNKVAAPSTPHHVHSFSWRVLSEFFITDSVSNAEKECLYLSKNRVIIRRRNSNNNERLRIDGHLEDISAFDSEEIWQQLLLESKMARMLNSNNYEDDNNLLEEGKIGGVEGQNNGNGTTNHEQIPPPHRLLCGKSRINEGWTWLCKYLINSFLSILNLVCSTLLFSCIRCRRRKGFQFTLMLPAFLTVFLGIFQQIPAIFTYSYAGISLTDEMNEASIRGVSPMYLAPIWDETQYHGQCCGVHGPETWMVRRRGVDQEMYPPSCCNTELYECNYKYAKRHEIWEKGCFKQEYDRVKFYEFLSMLVMLVKLLAEMGILWSLSDLTRYEYPRPEQKLNATCDVRDFEVQTKGCAVILGVTERQMMVVRLSKFNPRKYVFRTLNNGICKTINIRSVDGHAGCIEIRRPRRNRNTENAVVDLDRGREQGYIFISC